MITRIILAISGGFLCWYLTTGWSDVSMLIEQAAFDHSRSPQPEWAHKRWRDNEGQDIAEYAVMLAVILALVGMIRLVGSNANDAFSSVASSLQ